MERQHEARLNRAANQREVSFDLADFYHNESRLYGVDTLKRDLTASAEVLEALTAGFVAGDHAAPITETCGLGEAQEAAIRAGLAEKRPYLSHTGRACNAEKQLTGPGQKDSARLRSAAACSTAP